MPSRPTSAWLLPAAALLLSACQPPDEGTAAACDGPQGLLPSAFSTCAEPPPVPGDEPAPWGTGCLAPTWRVRQFGTPEDDLGVVAGVDEECNVYVAGTTRGVLEDGPGRGAFQDAFVARLNPEAQLQWVRQLGSRQDDTVRGLAVSRSGESFVVGTTLGDMPGQVSLGGSDAFVMKHDAAGALGWLSHRGSYQDDQGLAVALSERDAHVTVAGATMAKPEVGLDVMLDVLRAEDRAEVAFEQYGSDFSDRAEGIALDGAGGLYVTGSTLGHLGATNAGSFDAFLTRFTPGLKAQWVAQRSTRDIDAGMKVATDAVGNVYVLALSFSDLETERFENDGISSPFLLKYSADGGLRWVRRVGPAREPTRAAGLAVDAEGSIFVAGSTPGALAGPSQGGRDAFVVKFDAAGLQVWAQQLGTRGQDEAQDVVITRGGDLLLVGTTSGDFGGGSSGRQDVFVARFARSEQQ